MDIRLDKADIFCFDSMWAISYWWQYAYVICDNIYLFGCICSQSIHGFYYIASYGYYYVSIWLKMEDYT